MLTGNTTVIFPNGDAMQVDYEFTFGARATRHDPGDPGELVIVGAAWEHADAELSDDEVAALVEDEAAFARIFAVVQEHAENKRTERA